MNKEKWYRLSKTEKADDSLFIEAVVDESSPWFSGHFPGEPTLPGIAQLSIVTDAIKKHYNNFLVAEIKRVRFKQIIKPGNVLHIKIKKDNSNVSFKILVNDEVACNGVIVGK